MDVRRVVCCHVEVSATGCSLVQRISTECGVSVCDSETSKIRRPWPSRGYGAVGREGGGENYTSLMAI
jgi:hypothetical protein